MTPSGGGPPFNPHESEESHTVLHARCEYVDRDRRFTVEDHMGAGSGRDARTLSGCRMETFDTFNLLMAGVPDKHL